MVDQIKRTIVNIPDPHNTGARIVGYRLEEDDPALGKYGLSEPLDWFSKKMEAGIRGHDGQKILVQHILKTEANLSDTSKNILEMFLEE